jgi:hypothetical protein
MGRGILAGNRCEVDAGGVMDVCGEGGWCGVRGERVFAAGCSSGIVCVPILQRMIGALSSFHHL